MKALIDGDIIIYKIGFSTEDTEEKYVPSRIHEFVDLIMQRTQADALTMFLTASGKQGFRYKVDPSYKGHRVQPKPLHYEFIKNYLATEFPSQIGIELEADDLLTIAQSTAEEGTTMLCSIDKDALQCPGYHYRWPIMRKGKEIKSEQFIFIDELEGYKNFFKGLVIGDVADNIIGVRGIGYKKAEDLLGCCESAQEMFDAVREQYNDDERMLRNGQLMWLLRSETDKFTDRWKEWTNVSLV